MSHREPTGVELSLSPRAVARTLGVVVAGLVVAHLLGVVSTYVFHHEYVMGFVPLFNLDREGNIPTWFSSMLLLTCAATMAVIGRARRAEGDRTAWRWSGLAALFLFLALDEAAALHEKLSHEMSALQLSGFLKFAWVTVYVPFAAVVGVVYWRFLFSLPRRTALQFILAGALYVGGAAGTEMLAAPVAEANGIYNLQFALLSTVEETLEMCGVVVLLHALLRYAQETGAGRRLALTLPKPEAALGEPLPLPRFRPVRPEAVELGGAVAARAIRTPEG